PLAGILDENGAWSTDRSSGSSAKPSRRWSSRSKKTGPSSPPSCAGSLSHDTVWARSDIDLVLITIDDKKVEGGERALYADGVNVHAFLMPRAEFRKTVEGTVRNSFIHSFLAKGRLLYTHDPTIAGLCAGLFE